ncbi:MAG TPA: DUF2147 domain-containing protein [Chryseosolibacter sp.]
MKSLIALILVLPFTGFGQSIVGKWVTIDDNSGEEKSVVEIFEKGGKFFGKVTKLYRDANEDPDPVCDECDNDDPRYKKKIIGMEIIRDMKKSGEEYSDGDILDPENGKVYKCKLWIEGGELKVRGYWGPFFRTQSWKKAQ